MKRAALYIRVSTDQQAKHGDSLDEQLHTLNEYAEIQGDITIIDTYIDDGISGQKLLRDEFQRLLDDVKSKKIDTILFTKLDRWFRNLRHYLNVQEILDKNNVTWLAVSQPFFNTDTAYGRSFVNQSMSFAELEAQMTSERIRAVFDNKIRKGEVVSGKVPLGYKIKDKHLVPNEDADTVRDIFNHYIRVGSLRATVRYMDDELGLTRDYQSVKNLLTNRKYIGELRDNKNYCEPIIDKAIFDKVQDQLSKNIKQNKNTDYIFAGLLVCSECGRRFSASTVGSTYIRKDGTKNPKRHSHYRCPKNKNNPKHCTNKKGYRESTLEKFILDNIYKQAEQVLLTIESKPKVNKLKNSNDKINKKLDRLKSAYLNDVINLEEYKKDRAALEKQLVNIPDHDALKNNITTLKSYMTDDFKEEYSKLSKIDKAYIWRSIIRNLIIYPDGNITINFIDG
jgi:site-specific DNA recombinase